MESAVLVTAPIPQAALETLGAACLELRHWTQSPAIPRDQLLLQAQGVAGIYCLINDRIDAEVLEAAGPSLRVVSTMSVGYDHINVAACAARAVAVGNTPGVLTETTADLALALLLATARRIPEAVAAVRDGTWGAWKGEWMTGRDLFGSKVGIVGLGRIGQAVARRLAGFGCRLLYTGPAPKAEAEALEARFVSLEELLAESDFVTLHCPLNGETRHLMNTRTLAQMKPTAMLINTTRGGVVDQDALYRALRNGVIAAAGLDVTTPEPLPPDHPLLTLANCVVLPHIGSATIATRTRMAQMAAQNLIAGVRGESLPYAVHDARHAA
jgi:lactate dehydrogenase-like 2-hydroxyacid dehydrogenase